MTARKRSPKGVIHSWVIDAHALQIMKGISLTAIMVTLVGVVAAPQWAEAKPSVQTAAMTAQQSRAQDAEIVWQGILLRDPGNAQAYYNLGIAQANQLKWQAAIDSYEQAIALDPAFVHALCNLGQAQTQLGQYQAAAQSYRRALALNPGHGLAQEMLSELEVLAQHSGIDLAALAQW